METLIRAPRPSASTHPEVEEELRQEACSPPGQGPASQRSHRAYRGMKAATALAAMAGSLLLLACPLVEASRVGGGRRQATSTSAAAFLGGMRPRHPSSFSSSSSFLPNNKHRRLDRLALRDGPSTQQRGSGRGGEGGEEEEEEEEESKRYATIMREMAERYTAREELYRSETGLRMALSELDKVAATEQLLRAQEEQEREDTAQRQADADRLRAQLGGGRRSSSSRVDEAAAAAEGEAAGGNSPFTSGGGFPFPEPELPDFLDLKTLGLMGRWEEVGGNFLLRPPDHATNPPKAVLHFLGGAFVGAAPHLTYRYLLTGLAEKGFLVVATPYNLSFDYVQTCDMVLERFEKVAIPLAKEYGALPVVGIGHSCGALLHVLITCLFPDTPRLANALISFNNQKAQKAIPAFEELVVPLSVSLMGDDGLLGGSPVLAGDGGALGPGTALRQSLGRLRQNVEEVVEAYSASRLAPSVVRNEVVPLMKQVLSVVDQLPPLLQSISDGAREFAPTPDDTREVCRRMYRARRTLLVQFENDSIDESENLMKVLQESRSIMRMKRPLVKMDVRLETIKGTHITPLTQDIFRDPPGVVDVLNPLGPPVRRYAQEQFLATVRSVQALLVEWLEEGLAR